MPKVIPARLTRNQKGIGTQPEEIYKILLPHNPNTRPKKRIRTPGKSQKRKKEHKQQPEALLSGGPLRRIPSHHVSHNGDGVWPGVGDERGQRRRGKLGEFEVHLLRQRVTLRPVPLLEEEELNAKKRYMVEATGYIKARNPRCVLAEKGIYCRFTQICGGNDDSLGLCAVYQ